MGGQCGWSEVGEGDSHLDEAGEAGRASKTRVGFPFGHREEPLKDFKQDETI
jgi:hypothetical protein